MFSLSSPRFWLHVAGVIAVSQLLYSGRYHQEFFDRLNDNTTGVIHGAFDTFVDVLSVWLPTAAGGGIIGAGTLLRAMIYVAAAVYMFHLTRSARSVVDHAQV